MDSKFLVFKLPRTGSTMFGKVLNSHPDVSCKNEFLNHVKLKSKEEKLEYFKAFFNNNVRQEQKKNQKDIKVLGATLNPFKYKLRASDLSKEIDMDQFKTVILLRKNFLLQARSFYIVKETTNGLRFQLNKEDKKKLQAITFDFDQLEQITKRFEQKSKRLQQYVEKITKGKFLLLYYEELLESRQKCFNQLFDYIGAVPLSENFDYTGGHEKILTDDWRSICKNFDEINNYPYLTQFL